MTKRASARMSKLTTSALMSQATYHKDYQMHKPNYKFSISSNGAYSLNREWNLSTPFAGDLTAVVTIANNGEGDAEVKKIHTFDDGLQLELMSDNEFEARVQAIHEHEGMTLDEARDWLDTQNVWSFKLFYGVRGWDPQRVVDDAVATWQALNMIADFQL